VKAGDLFCWKRVAGGDVDPREMLWSSSMAQYVPIGGLCLFVALDGDQIVWLGNEGLFHVSEEDSTLGDVQIEQAQAKSSVMTK
jgi:hypothetical protein